MWFYGKAKGTYMDKIIENLVFEGGGILGIAYLGVLDYLHKNGLMANVKRASGTSAGAITACITSFQLPFNDVKLISDSLDYKKVADKREIPIIKLIPSAIRNEIDKLFGNADCIYRLLNNYGWYSSEYFYQWIKDVIASQFDSTKKQPPYTFADFNNPLIHKQQRSFLDLYIIGTDISSKIYRVFSFETTPEMEVAQAVRISMSIPLFFEAIKVDNYDTISNYNTMSNNNVAGNSLSNVFSDGGIMNNYPLNIFDSPKYSSNLLYGANMNTVGARLNSNIKYTETNNLLEFIWNLLNSFLRVQQEIYNNSQLDISRSINIYTQDVLPFDFNVALNDKTYKFLYTQGYNAASTYFTVK